MNALPNSPAAARPIASRRTAATGTCLVAAGVGPLTVGADPCRVGATFAPRIVPAAALAIAMAFGVLAGTPHPVRAQDPDGEEKRSAPMPTSGIEMEFWSDPPAGSLVQPGSRARLYARANEGCYLTVFRVDTDGRMRPLYPSPSEDGWVEGGHTYQLPEPGSGYDLRFAGPSGMEYVYALVSIHPLRSRYPSWMVQGEEPTDPPKDRSSDIDPYRDGLVVGDPFYQVRAFCKELVPYPEQCDSYATAWVYFHLGRRVPYPRFLCSDCHWGGAVDPYGPACPAMRPRVGDVRCSGQIDFRLAWLPRYTYEVWTGWRPRTWHGDRWNGPDGRWVWSSADGHRLLGGHFSDARPPDHRGSRSWNRDPGGDGRGDPRSDPRSDPRGEGVGGREVRPQRPEDTNVWGRSFEERLRRSIGERGEPRDPTNKPAPAKPRKPEVRNAAPRPGVPSPRLFSLPDRSGRTREGRRAKDSPQQRPDRLPKDGHGRSR